jgi:hypothetical protein
VQHECVEEDDHAQGEEVAEQEEQDLIKGLGHEIEFKYLDKNLLLTLTLTGNGSPDGYLFEGV